MKTTVELPDDLLEQTRQLAESRGWSMKMVFEESLRSFLNAEADSQPRKPFQLRHTIVEGQGLQNPNLSWDEIRELAYADRLRKIAGVE